MKKLLLTLIIFLSCVFISENVHAEEYEYTIYGQVLYTSSGNGLQYYTLEYDIVYNLSYKIAAVASYSSGASKWTFAIIYLDESGNDVRQTLLTKFNCSKYYTKRTKYDDSARTVVGWSDSPYNMDFSVGSNYKYEIVNMSISIPIFETQEEAAAYLNGELTEKDAINYESDLCKIKYDLEIPQNMKAVQDEGLFSGAMKFTWTQSAEGYEEWETEFYVFEDFKYRSSFLTLSLADWKYAENFYLFTEYVDTRKLYFRITEEIFEKHEVQKKRSDAYPCDYGGYYDPLVDTYYIRNHYFDGELHHYSNWVVVTFDYESGDIVTNIKEVSGSEIEVDDSGNVVVGESEKVQDSQYDDDYDVYSKESSSDIVNFIRSGFGLLGEDGVLTLLSQTFSFIPAELWSVFIAGMALMVLIAVAKFVRG